MNPNPKWNRHTLDAPKVIGFVKWIWTEIHCEYWSGSDNRIRPRLNHAEFPISEETAASIWVDSCLIAQNKQLCLNASCQIVCCLLMNYARITVDQLTWKHDKSNKLSHESANPFLICLHWTSTSEMRRKTWPTVETRTVRFPTSVNTTSRVQWNAA